MTSLTLLMIVEDEFQITHTYVKELWGQLVTRVGGDPESMLKLSDTLHVQPCQTNVVDSWWRTHNQSYQFNAKHHFVKSDIGIAHLRRGRPVMNHKPRLRWRDSCSDLLYAKTSFTAGDFDFITDRSFEKGETRKRFTIWTPWWRSDSFVYERFRCVHWWCNQLKQLMLVIASSTEVTPPLRGV